MKHIFKKYAAVIGLITLLTGCGFDGSETNFDGISPTVQGYTSVTMPETEAPTETTTEETTVTGPVALSIEETADEILKGMSAEEKIGQLILAHSNVTDVPEQAAKYNLGGVLFFADDFKNSDPEAFKTQCRQISSGLNIKPFLAVDEEGGEVVRVSKFRAFRDKPFESPMDIYKRGGVDLIITDTQEKAQLLSSVGLNLNLAPVADISEDKHSYIYYRTLGLDAEGTAECVRMIVRNAGQNGVASCMKHFPGYGENTDTHKDTAHDSRELYEFYNRDFAVFEAGLSANKDSDPAIMVNHTIYDSIDDQAPASLSKVVHGVLRNKLKFDGVAITDDLGMEALKDYSGEESVYVAAIKADNDMICVPDAAVAYTSLARAYNSGSLTSAELNKHVRRILIMKLEHGIIT